MREFELIPAYIILDFWQYIFTYQIFSFSEWIPTKDIFLVILQIGDEKKQSSNQSKLDFL